MHSTLSNERSSSTLSGKPGLGSVGIAKAREDPSSPEGAPRYLRWDGRRTLKAILELGEPAGTDAGEHDDVTATADDSE